jgi:hypothetical protein
LFRLAKVLGWKRRQERSALVDRAAAEHRAAVLEGAMRDAVQARAAFPDAAADTESLRAWSEWGEGLRRKEDLLARRLQALRPEVEEKARVHQELRREVKGLERLEERHVAALRKRREHLAQEGLDEAAARRSLPGDGRNFPSEAAVPAGDEGTPAHGTAAERGPAPNRGMNP